MVSSELNVRELENLDKAEHFGESIPQVEKGYVRLQVLHIPECYSFQLLYSPCFNTVCYLDYYQMLVIFVHSPNVANTN